LKPLHERASKLSRQLRYFAIEHVLREMNRDADALANVALDSGEVSVSASSKPERLDSAAETRLGDPLDQPSGPSSRPALSLSHTSFFRRSIHARFLHGALVPSEPLNLPEGAEVEFDLRISNKK